MANETQITFSITSTVGGVVLPRVQDSVSQDRTNSEYYLGSLLVTSTHAQLAIAGAITEDNIRIRNIGASVVHVQTGSSGTTGRFSTLKASGGFCFFPIASGVSIYVVCESGQTSDISFTILSD